MWSEGEGLRSDLLNPTNLTPQPLSNLERGEETEAKGMMMVDEQETGPADEVQVPTWAEHQALMAEVRELAYVMRVYFDAVRLRGRLTSGEIDDIMRRVEGVIERTVRR